MPQEERNTPLFLLPLFLYPGGRASGGGGGGAGAGQKKQ